MSMHEHFSSENAWRKGPGIPAGKDVERSFLGSASVPTRERQDEYMSFEQALNFARKHQPNLLERSPLIKNLRSRVVSLCTDVTTPVRFFTAVGTPLDTYHGVDAFFEQSGRVATIDVSLRAKGIHKADVLIVATLDEDGHVAVDEIELAQAAQKIAEQLNKRLERRAA